MTKQKTLEQQVRTDAFARVHQSVMLSEQPKQKFASPGPASRYQVNNKQRGTRSTKVVAGRS